jgi:hypothetical protein
MSFRAHRLRMLSKAKKTSRMFHEYDTTSNKHNQLALFNQSASFIFIFEENSTWLFQSVWAWFMYITFEAL